MTRVLTLYHSQDLEVFHRVEEALEAFKGQQVVDSTESLAVDKCEKLDSEATEGRSGSGNEALDALVSGAEVLIVLLSQSFAAQDLFGWLTRELNRLRDNALIILVALEMVPSNLVDLSGFLVLPSDGKPIPEHDKDAWTNVNWAIRQEIRYWQGSGHIVGCDIKNFTVFENVSPTFVKGLNVLTGTNASGKTHLLKLLYALSSRPGDISDPTVLSVLRSLPNDQRQQVHRTFHAMTMLRAVFMPAELNAGHLVRAASGELAEVGLRCKKETLRVTVQRSDNPQGTTGGTGDPSSGTKTLFIPSREVLAMYEGFVAAYEKRELSFDETYYDLCKALSSSPLRDRGGPGMKPMLEALERLLGGEVRLSGNRFYIRTNTGDLEAHLLAEGLRKLAVLAHLIKNGSLTPDTVLFWDEPEANLHPRLVVALATILRQLAECGVQVFLATHDYLLVRELSLAAEYKTEPVVPIRFFSLFRPRDDDPVEVEAADVFTDLEHNPILEEFSAHYEREQALFYADGDEGTGS